MYSQYIICLVMHHFVIKCSVLPGSLPGDEKCILCSFVFFGRYILVSLFVWCESDSNVS